MSPITSPSPFWGEGGARPAQPGGRVRAHPTLELRLAPAETLAEAQ